MNYALIINKEKGFTSRDVVNKLNKLLKTKKIGHTGTLDPLASGVLVCLIGKYTKLESLITSLEKEYIAEIKLGIKTDTLDITGNIIEENNQIDLSVQLIDDVLKSFIGEYEQTIPKYSAVHVNGKRLYEYARENIDIELPKNKVFIKEIALLEYKKNIIKFKCLVSKGTYIRSLIQSICDKLGVIGTMSELIRTKQGRFNIESAFSLADVENNNYNKLTIESLLNVEVMNIPNDLFKRIANGNIIELDKNGYVLFKNNDVEFALYHFENNIGVLKILF